MSVLKIIRNGILRPQITSEEHHNRITLNDRDNLRSNFQNSIIFSFKFRLYIPKTIAKQGRGITRNQLAFEKEIEQFKENYQDFINIVQELSDSIQDKETEQNLQVHLCFYVVYLPYLCLVYLLLLVEPVLMQLKKSTILKLMICQDQNRVIRIQCKKHQG